MALKTEKRNRLVGERELSKEKGSTDAEHSKLPAWERKRHKIKYIIQFT